MTDEQLAGLARAARERAIAFKWPDAEGLRLEGWHKGDAAYIAAWSPERALAALECVAALRSLSDMYAQTWDRVDGALVMMHAGVGRFENVHLRAIEALEAWRALNARKP